MQEEEDLTSKYIICENQNGFSLDRGCVDDLFIIQ